MKAPVIRPQGDNEEIADLNGTVDHEIQACFALALVMEIGVANQQEEETG